MPQQRDPPPSPVDPLVRQIVAYYWDRAQRGNVKKTDVARDFSISERLLYKLFHRYLHTTPAVLPQYISTYFLLIDRERQRTFTTAAFGAGFEDTDTARYWWNKCVGIPYEQARSKNTLRAILLDEDFLRVMRTVLHILSKRWGDR